MEDSEEKGSDLDMLKAWNRLAIALGAIFLVVAFAGVYAGAANNKSINWITDYDKGIKEGKRLNKPVMIDFYADWCPPCRQMNETTFKNQQVIDLSRKFVCVKVDVDKNEGPSKKHSVRYLPTIVFADSKAKELSRSVGYADANKLASEMKDALKKLNSKK